MMRRRAPNEIGHPKMPTNSKLPQREDLKVGLSVSYGSSYADVSRH